MHFSYVGRRVGFTLISLPSDVDIRVLGSSLGFMFFSNRVVRRQVYIINPGHLTAGGVEFLGENLCKTNGFSYTSTSN